MNYKILFNDYFSIEHLLFHEIIKLYNIRLRHINLESKILMARQSCHYCIVTRLLSIWMEGRWNYTAFTADSIAISEL